jgi:hypothetical protein
MPNASIRLPAPGHLHVRRYFANLTLSSHVSDSLSPFEGAFVRSTHIEDGPR